MNTAISENFLVDVQLFVKNIKNLLEMRCVINIMFSDQFLIFWHFLSLKQCSPLSKILLFVLIEMQLFEKEDGSVYLKEVLEVTEYIDVLVILGVPNMVCLHLFWL